MREIDENSYILGYWFASDGENDWYMMIWKESSKADWRIQYTFRYHKDDDPWGGEDEKKVYSFKAHASQTDDEMLASIEEIWDEVKKKYNHFNDYFLVKGNCKKFMEIAKTKSYLHFKELH